MKVTLDLTNGHRTAAVDCGVNEPLALSTIDQKIQMLQIAKRWLVEGEKKEGKRAK